MTESEQKLIAAFDDVVWMAIRYAHGRHTYAPSMVRDAIKAVQSVDPGWKPRPDHTLDPYPEDRTAWELKSDYLNDLFE